MSFRSSRQNAMQQKYYKKGIDVEGMKRGREDQNWSLRKQKRNLALSKRRNISGEDSAPPNIKDNPKVEDLPRFAKEIRSSDPSTQFDAIYCVRSLLSASENPPIEQIISLGIARDLITILSYSEDPSIQYQCAWALTNIACGTNEQTNALLDYGAVPAFISILNGNYDEAVKDQAIWALGNIAADSTPFRDFILHQNVLDTLVQIISQTKGRLQVTGTWCVANLCRGKPEPSFDITKQIIPALLSLLRSDTREQVKGDACWAIAHLSGSSSAERISYLFDSGLTDCIIPLLRDSSVTIHTPAVRVVGNIASGDDNFTEQMVNAGTLPLLADLFEQTSNDNLAREICWTLSNIAAGSKMQTQRVLEENALIETLFSRAETLSISVKREIAWIVTNICSGGTAEQVYSIVQHGAIDLFSDFLSVPDQNLVLIVLEGLENIFASGDNIRELSGSTNPYMSHLESSGGLTKLNQLAEQTQPPLLGRILQFIDQYDVDDEMEEEYLIPRIDSNRQEFVFGFPMIS